MKAGAQDFLTKPVATDVLLVAVEQAVARDRENRAGKRNSTACIPSSLHSRRPSARCSTSSFAAS